MRGEEQLRSLGAQLNASTLESCRAMGCRAEVASAVYPVATHLHGAMTREERRPATERENHGGQPFTRVTQYKVSYIILMRNERRYWW